MRCFKGILLVLAVLGLCTAGSGCVQGAPLVENDRDADGIQDGVDPNPTSPTPQTISFGGRTRSYTVRLPAGYTPGSERTLVMVLHGTGQTPSSVRGVAGWDELADANGLIAAYPEAVELNWNDGRDVAGIPAYDQNVDDVGFLTTLIDRLAADYRADKRRVYVAGFSNGGIMAYRLAFDAPERFAAIAPVCASVTTDFESFPAPAVATPLIIFNSTTDPTLPYNGGDLTPLGVFISVPETVAYWAGINGTSGVPEETALPDSRNDGCTVTRYYYPSDAPGVPVDFYRITGAGHNWPGGPAGQALTGGTVCQDIDASALMWEFFEQFTR